MADVHRDAGGDVRREALDLHLAQDLVEDAAGVLDAQRNSQQLHTHADAQSLVQSNALQVDVNQVVIERLALPVDDHRLGRALAGDFNVEDRVVAGLGEENPGDLLGVHLDG